ncbi:MAG TPA: hypothetical protein DCL61_29115 [Cyanobacteria bacterium UBA12227]|nr:hypothetical protein [Cyanobacteria bacterium UBA12227]HAX87325.1 hypothetical protein [Cyanobacteria bacterium UBA11370]HBY81721.1 hypothetical protein [Cyanobacteria bacterium UBA11148]
MSLFFMIPLSTFFVAVYIFKKSADEIAYISAAIALVSLLLTLLLAPWQIQLSLLILILFSNRRKPLSSESSFESESTTQEKVKLLYRGANYELNSPTPDMIEDEITGKYRGQVWIAHDLVKSTVVQPTLNIKYRGVCVATQNSITSVVENTLVDEVEVNSVKVPERN